MLKELADIFTDRREALALFERIRGRDPSKPWLLLPGSVALLDTGDRTPRICHNLEQPSQTLSGPKSVRAG